MRAAVRVVAAAAVVVVAGTACSAGTPEPRPVSTNPPISAPPPSSSPPQTQAELAAQKRAARIADCPVSSSDAAVVTRGLPDLTLSCLGGGREVRLAGLRGRPMMINIWAQWCGPCRAEAPYLADVAGRNRSELLIMGVDYNDPQPGLALEFARLVGWRYPQLVDRTAELRAPLQITGPPQTFFVTADGRIAHRHVGPFDSAAEIRSLVGRHLGVDL